VNYSPGLSLPSSQIIGMSQWHLAPFSFMDIFPFPGNGSQG
jgi:hypothetical protein